MRMRSDWKPNGSETELDRLFAEYRNACPDPEPGPDFMPRLWQKIGARQSFASRVAVFARGLVGAAAVLALLLFALAVDSNRPAFYQNTYVDVLATAHVPDQAAGLDPAQFDPDRDLLSQ